MRQCKNCGKGSRMVGKRLLLRGHYNPTSKSRKYPNLQWARVPAKGGSPPSPGYGRAGASGGNSVRKRVCAQCLKSLHKATRVK